MHSAAGAAVTTIERILCAVEMRLDDINVLACACLLARPFGARVDTLLVRDGHGVPTHAPRPKRGREPDARREAELLFAELLASTPGSRLPDTHVGSEPRAILQRFEQCASDFIVLGLRRLSAAGPARVVELADELSRCAPCPVMTVPGGTPTTPITRILLPVDFSAATEGAIAWAESLAQRFSASVHVLHAVGSPALREPPSRRGEPLRTTIERARARLERIEQRLRASAVSCDSSIVERGTTHAILACREQLDSNLIVMGVHHHPSARLPASGMVATIRSRAPVPVLSMTAQAEQDALLLADPTATGSRAMQGEAMSATALA